MSHCNGRRIQNIPCNGRRTRTFKIHRICNFNKIKRSSGILVSFVINIFVLCRKRNSERFLNVKRHPEVVCLVTFRTPFSAFFHRIFRKNRNVTHRRHKINVFDCVFAGSGTDKRTVVFLSPGKRTASSAHGRF